MLKPVWHERSRHAALGGVVLGTATIAAFSMCIAVNESLGRASALHLLPALLWFVFILNLDRLLVTSMVGSGRRASTLLMRLGVALMFGIIIAEPLVMRIFQTAIEEHIREARSARLDNLRSDLVRCNGEPSAVDTPVPANCRDRLLSFDVTPVSIQRELDSSRTEQANLRTVVERESGQLNVLRDNANKECAGTSGAGLTGERGYGRQCLQRIQDADEYSRAHQIPQNIAKLGALQTRIVALDRELGEVRSNFERIRDDKVAERVAEAKSHQQAIGFLERLDAMHELASQSFALAVSSWAIRIFFILIDCLPVLVKFFGGASGYDELFKVKSASNQRVFGEQTKTDETLVLEDLAKTQDEAESRARLRRAELDLKFQEHKAEMKARLGDAVRSLAAELRAPARPHAAANGHRGSSEAGADSPGWSATNGSPGPPRSPRL